MILTLEILNRGKSSNSGFGKEQLEHLGVKYPLKKGWTKDVLGKDFPQKSIDLFLSMKDQHLSIKPEKSLSQKPIICFEPCTDNIKYKDQYKHPNWQKMRLFVLNRDRFKCVNCGEKTKTLHVHHLKYSKGFVWQVPHWYLVTLCETCHSEEHGRDLSLK